MTVPPIAIYGATGHTGRLVAAELLSRGREVVLSGRNAEALKAVSAELAAPERVRTHPAPLDDIAALRDLAENASVLIHCAGPFSVTGEPVAAAAAAAGCHYIDHAVESHHVKRMFDAYFEPARRSGAIMIPGLSFYGGLGDLLAAAAADGLSETDSGTDTEPDSGIDRVVVAYSVSGWRMTTGAKNTAAQLFAETERITFSDGAQHVGYVEPRNAVFPFPPPLGPRTMIAPFPSCEIVTIPRHVPARNVDLLITSGTFEEEQVFASEDADPAERALADFTVAVQAVSPPHSASGQVSGRDLWRAGVLASVEGAVRLADGRGPGGGVLSAAEAFAAEPFLRTLERQGAFTATLQTSAR